MLSCQLTIAAANGTRLTTAAPPARSQYLEHQAEQDDHGQTRHHIGVVLDHKLVAQHRRALVLLAETHGSSIRLSPLRLRAAAAAAVTGPSWVGAGLSLLLRGCYQMFALDPDPIRSHTERAAAVFKNSHEDSSRKGKTPRRSSHFLPAW